ncbi:hypothetical protein CVT24_006970 [Panaeolus cyanescens]|uniref:F-box domain-containing protein n=1 Tax=Panaeolus cyanescens TaxID=181874 RepID=A0A409YX84_9AGAR|nr:hypothetical protein CVT24_006970 [Panaeolus cyanescens]
MGRQIHVKCLYITAYVPEADVQTFDDNLRRLYQLCPSLEGLDLSPGSRLPTAHPISLPIPPHLTRLNLGPLLDEDIYEHVLGFAAPTVTQLSLYNFEPRQPLNFPLLVELHLIEGRNGKSPVLPGYTLPCLERATFAWAPLDWINHPNQLQYFCETHGKRLKMLQIQESFIGGASYYKRLREDSDYILFQNALDLCPRLEHIVLHPHALRGLLRHPNVRWVDIWEPPVIEFPVNPTCPNRWKDLKKNITKEAFPQLKGIRTIASTFRPLNRSLPLVFPPSLCDDPSFQPFSIEFEGLHLQHDVGRIFSPPHECFDDNHNADRTWDGDSHSECDNEAETEPTEAWTDISDEDDDEYVPPSSSEDEDESSIGDRSSWSDSEDGPESDFLAAFSSLDI